MHKKNRNIVLASALGRVLDVSFGPSDDDFHYQAEHGTVSHDDENVAFNDNQIDVKLVFQGESYCEVQYATGDAVNNEYKWDGFINISESGVSFPLWTENEVPVWVEFKAGRVQVFTYEGAPPDDQRDQWRVFDTNNLTNEE